MCMKDTGWRGSHVLTRKWIGLEIFWDFFRNLSDSQRNKGKTLYWAFQGQSRPLRDLVKMGASQKVSTVINQIPVEF